MTKETVETIAQKWVDDNQEWFETALLWFLIHDEGVWRTMAPVVCVSSNDTPVRDFTETRHTAIYQVIAAHRKALGAAIEGKISRESYVLALQNAAVSGAVIGFSEVAPAIELYDALVQQDYRQLKPVVVAGLRYWLGKQRVGALLTSELSHRNWQADGMLGRMTTEINSVNTKLLPTTHISEFTTSVLTRTNDKVECLTSGLFGLDKLLGGGFHKGDGHLMIAATGVGKTVAACQFAVEFALNGHVVCFITTEQPMNQLEPRWVSNMCHVPFDQISRGFTIWTLTPEQRERALRLGKSIANRLFVFDWNKQRKSVLAGGIEEEVRYCIERTGRCDAVILDWLGGGLTDDVMDDKDKKRLAMQNTADRMATIATDFHVPTITFAQAHKVTGINNMYVGVRDVPDCKTVDQKMAAVVGMTGMFDKQTKERIKAGESPFETGGSLYDDMQWFFISKCRFGTGGHMPFRRDFRFQRMVDTR